jgi:hypothetical protein
MGGIGGDQFGRALGILLRGTYGTHSQVRGYGDPAGTQRSQVDGRTVFDELLAQGLPISPTRTNDWTLRRDTVGSLCMRFTPRGRPALAIHPRAKTLIKAMSGGYCLRRLQVPGRERFADFPDKGPFSHVAESFQYGCLGEGLDAAVLGGAPDSAKRPSPVQVRLTNGQLKQSSARVNPRNIR